MDLHYKTSNATALARARHVLDATQKSALSRYSSYLRKCAVTSFVDFSFYRATPCRRHAVPLPIKKHSYCNPLDFDLQPSHTKYKLDLPSKQPSAVVRPLMDPRDGIVL